MAACKCRFCQAKLTTATAYKTEVNKKPAYFCNEDHYKEFIQHAHDEAKKKEQEKKLQSKVYSLFCDVLGVTGVTNTMFWKEKTEINKVYSDTVIIGFLEENKDWITNAVRKLNGGEYGKIRYISTILKNKLGDYKQKNTTRTISYTMDFTDEHYETKFKLKPRQALLELEEDCYE